MLTKISKWGNSQGIRIPKEVLGNTGLEENDKVIIRTEGNRIVIEKADGYKFSNLKERLESFYNKPIEDICVEDEY